MFHKALKLSYAQGTELEITFDTGEVKRYDVSALFPKYPQLEALRDRELFTSGKLMGAYGIIWNDELDLEAETVYEDGITVRTEKKPENAELGSALKRARAQSGMSQSELSAKTGIDQSDISKIECGAANPSVGTLKRIAAALNTKLQINFIK